MPNRTRISRAIRTIACPSCKLRLRVLIGVLGTVDRICSNDDVVANCLLNQWSNRLERVPSVTLIGSLPVAGVTLLHPAPRFGGGTECPGRREGRWASRCLRCWGR